MKLMEVLIVPLIVGVRKSGFCSTWEQYVRYHLGYYTKKIEVMWFRNVPLGGEKNVKPRPKKQHVGIS